MARKVVAKQGKLHALNMRTTAEVRTAIDEAARSSGRSRASEAERRLLLSFEWEKAFGDAKAFLDQNRAKVEDITAANVKAKLRALGWRRIVGKGGNEAYLPPGAVDVFQEALQPPPEPVLTPEAIRAWIREEVAAALGGKKERAA